MKFDTPATTNPIDQLKVIGKPTDRIDGPLKTTGSTPYAYEHHHVAPDAAYGYVVGSAIAKGRATSIDVLDARSAPGVLAIVTASNAGQLHKADRNTARVLAGPEIEHYHQAIALVVAETFEQARAAAQLIRVKYVATRGSFDLAAAKGLATRPPRSGPSGRETFESAVAIGAAALEKLGTDPVEIAEISAHIRERDEQRLQLEIVGGLDAGKALFSGRATHTDQSVSQQDG